MNPRFYYEKVAGIQQNKSKVFQRGKETFGCTWAHRFKKGGVAFTTSQFCSFNRADVDATSK